MSLCGDTAPCGKYAAQILQQADVTIPETKVTRGVDVKATLAAVSHGDADAAIVYVTDAKTAGKDVAAVTIPDDQNAIAVYPIATLTSSANQEVSKAFIDYVTGDRGPGRPAVLRVPPTAMNRRARRVPWLAVPVALVAFAFIVTPLIGLIRQVPWGDLWDDLQTPEGHGGAPPLGHLLALGDGAVGGLRRPAGVGARPGRRSRAAPSCGRSCCFRWSSRRWSVASGCSTRSA